KRVWPGRDEKILAGWNGWMLAAFAEAAVAFDRYDDVVRRNADFLLTRIVDGRLVRHAKIPGLLEDYSGVAWGLTLAYEATGQRRYLDGARTLADAMLVRFRDEENGGFYDTPVDHEKLITRPKDLFDNATPAASSVAADVLLRLALLFGNEEYARVATETLESEWPLAERYASGFGFLLGVCEWRNAQPKEIALTGDVSAFLRAIGETFIPHRVLVHGAQSADLPLMEGRPDEKTLAYVCVGYACKEPVSDAARLRDLLV
ncbi:MAG TPA: thioredoxin domain-containing protein, partial [Thermoanaerobaculia bacterium]|nr:thioredoxin domain-containing protein [Thermoanaerobaculia bacterium]